MKLTSLKDLAGPLLGKLPKADGLIKWGLLGLAAFAATAAIVALLWNGEGDYTALYGAQENLPTSQIVTVLDGEKLEYRIDPNSGQILVPRAALSKTRMTLAAKGVQAILPSGYELMDKDEVLGSSQFVQNVRYKRSLEGELAQSIMTLNAVESARVQLALNEESSFVINNQPENSASVVVRLRYGVTLTDDNVNAIIHLVSGSIPGLKPSRVSVVDQAGNLLSDGVSEEAQSAGATRKRDRLLKDIQDKTRASLSNVLVSLVGQNNFRVSVMPQLDLSQIDETQERLGDTPKVSHEKSSQEHNTDKLAMGIPGSLSNRPPETGAAAPAAGQNGGDTANAPSQALSQHTESQRDYAYDRTVQHIQHQGFEIKRLNVAVVLNQDSPTVKGWTPEQREQVTALLNSAAGINAERGDKLSLSTLSFLPAAQPVEEKEPWWQNAGILAWARLGGGILLVLVLLFVVIRPLIKRLSAPKERAPLSEEPASALPQESDERNADPSGEDERKNVDLPSFSGDDGLPPQSSGLETKVEFLKKLAINDTDRVAEVIRQWITSNERIDNK